MRIIKTTILAALLATFAMPSAAMASFYANCQLQVAIQKILKPAEKTKHHHRIKVKLKVLKIGRQSGHTRTYCSARKMQGKTFQVFLRGDTKNDLPTIVKGTTLRIKYSHFSGRSAKGGVSSSTTWWIKTKAKVKPKTRVLVKPAPRK